jgi:hypothetical protein
MKNENIQIFEVVEEFFSALNKQNISYVVLRNYENLPYDVGNDLDILIDKSEIKQVNEILLDIFQKFNLFIKKNHIRFSYQGIYIESLLFKEFNLQIDLYTSLVKGWIKYSNGKVILQNRVKYKGFYIPEPSHELQAIIFKELFAYTKVRPKYFDQIEKLREKIIKKNFFEVGEKYITKNSYNVIYRKIVDNNPLVDIKIKPKLINFLNIKSMIFWTFYNLKDKI